MTLNLATRTDWPSEYELNRSRTLARNAFGAASAQFAHNASGANWLQLDSAMRRHQDMNRNVRRVYDNDPVSGVLEATGSWTLPPRPAKFG